MTGLSSSDALTALQALGTEGNPPLTVEEVKNIVTQVDSSIPDGNTVVFYSKNIGDTAGYKVVEKLAMGN